ncbi:MAG TPA: mercuric reductase [Acidobacteriaceae bacterium]|nr:mercuric reductase [Acidobacteriaceae bacterium]
MSADAGTTEDFDAIIIGSGQGGNPLAGALTAAGKKTALIERQDVGGTCINRGCTPTKTMVASARVAYLARRGADYGVDVGPIVIDMGRVRERKRSIVSSFRAGREKRLETAHVELIRGEASFTGPRQIRVMLRGGGERLLKAAQVFINTGTRSSAPAIAGLDAVSYFDNESIMELDRVPQQLLIVGGGYIGVEFCQMFRRFGSKVTVIQSGPQLLKEEDQDVAAEVTKILRQDGIEVLLNAHTQRVALANGVITLTAAVEGKTQTIEGTDLLLATGRVPNTAALKPGAAGIETDEHGFIRANERLETSAPGIYVIGDVKGGPQFTHISYDDYRILKANLLDGGRRTVRDRMVPYTVFMDPQLGRVGMTEKEAQKSGKKFRVARMPMTSVARALEMDETRGLMKAIVDAETEEILGATVLGIEGGEVMTVLEMAMMGHMKYTVLRDGVFAHPTLSESLNNLFFHFDDGQ